jgi:hypothetical protein
MKVPLKIKNIYSDTFAKVSALSRVMLQSATEVEAYSVHFAIMPRASSTCSSNARFHARTIWLVVQMSSNLYLPCIIVGNLK